MVLLISNWIGVELMGSRGLTFCLCAMMTLGLVGCDDQSSSTPQVDAGEVDGGVHDAGEVDGSVHDAGPVSLGDLTGPWQLFIDDYLVESKTNLVRTYHEFAKDPRNPVMVADRPWEGTIVYIYGTVLPKEDGTGYRMWYQGLSDIEGRNTGYVLYAESPDGIQWQKPNLGIRDMVGSTQNNILFSRPGRDCLISIMHTPWDPDPDHRDHPEARGSGWSLESELLGAGRDDQGGGPGRERLGDVWVRRSRVHGSHRRQHR